MLMDKNYTVVVHVQQKPMQILIRREGILQRDLEKVNEDLHAATEFQIRISCIQNITLHYPRIQKLTAT